MVDIDLYKLCIIIFYLIKIYFYCSVMIKFNKRYVDLVLVLLVWIIILYKFKSCIFVGFIVEIVVDLFFLL